MTCLFPSLRKGLELIRPVQKKKSRPSRRKPGHQLVSAQLISARLVSAQLISAQLISALSISAFLFMALPAAAAKTAKERLIVYTYDAFIRETAPGLAIEKAFEAQCDCDLEFVALDSSISILGRLQLEGANTKADIILGLDTNLMVQAKKTGLIARHEADLTSLELPVPGWDDAFFVPFDYGYFAFVYNSKKLETAPSSFESLLNDNPDLKIVVQDPRSSTAGLGLLLWIKFIYGDKAPEVWEQLGKKIVTITKSWSDAYFNIFLSGEADMVLSYSTSPAYHSMIDNDPEFKAAIFSEGHYMQIEVAAALSSSKNPELARQFMQFIVSNSFQNQIPAGNWMYPVTPVTLPEKFRELEKPARSLLFSPEEVENKRHLWLDEWLQEVSK